MKQIYMIPLVSLAVAMSVGCGSGSPSASDDKQLRESFAKKNFDIQDVPPEHRAMVQGMMDAAKKNAAAGHSPGEGK